MPFILIGDSGQQDPEIYAEIIRRHAQRVLAVYVWDVSKDKARDEAIRVLSKEVTRSGGTLILAQDTLQMAQQAADNGWIATGAIGEIRCDIEANLEGDG